MAFIMSEGKTINTDAVSTETTRKLWMNYISRGNSLLIIIGGVGALLATALATNRLQSVGKFFQQSSHLRVFLRAYTLIELFKRRKEAGAKQKGLSTEEKIKSNLSLFFTIGWALNDLLSFAGLNSHLHNSTGSVQKILGWILQPTGLLFSCWMLQRETKGVHNREKEAPLSADQAFGLASAVVLCEINLLQFASMITRIPQALKIVTALMVISYGTLSLFSTYLSGKEKVPVAHSVVPPPTNGGYGDD